MIREANTEVRPVTRIVMWLIILAVGVILTIVTTASSGSSGDWISVLVDIELLVAGAMAGIGTAIFMGVNQQYIFRRPPNVLLWVLLLLTTTGLALALNNLLWDRIYQGEHYTIAGSFIMLIFPAVWLYFLKFFRKDKEQSSVWLVVAAAAISLSVLILIWVIGEKVL